MGRRKSVMRIEEVMRRGVRPCSVHDTLAKGARRVWDGGTGCAPVVDDQGNLVGLLTEHDICRAACTVFAPASETPITVAMTHPAPIMMQEASVEAAHETMRRHRLRWVAVADERGRLVGVLSLDDLGLHAAQRLSFDCSPFRAEQVVVTLAATIENPHGLGYPAG